MYAALWRVLPGPWWARALQCLVLAAAVVAGCFQWVFPRLEPLLPFTQTTVDTEGGGSVVSPPANEPVTPTP